MTTFRFNVTYGRTQLLIHFKTLFLLSFFTLTTASLKSQYVNIPDPEFKSFLINRGHDINIDGEIDSLEALLVSSIIDYNSDIKDLTGINAFKNIERIDLDGGALEFLELDGLNYLDRLDVSENPIKTLKLSNLNSLRFLIALDAQLESAELINLPSLREVNMNRNNLTSLDFPSSPVLSIGLTDNNIHTLNVDSLDNLKQLILNDNNLEELRIGNCSDLTILACRNNRLRELELQNNNKLEDLVCSNNNLSILDITEKPFLERVICSNNNISDIVRDHYTNSTLEALYADSNAISTLNISRLTNLRFLDVNENNLSELIIPPNSPLVDLNCQGNSLSQLNTQNAKDLYFLDCSRNKISSLDLTGLDNLRELNIYSNLLKEIDLSDKIYLKKVLAWNNAIEQLDISGLIRLQEAIFSANNLSAFHSDKNPSLHTLSLAKNNLEDTFQLASHSLLFLNLSDNNFSSVDVSNNTSLDHLYVHNNDKLESLFMKNGNHDNNINISGNPILSYICVDEIEKQNILQLVNDEGYLTVINGYCSFVPPNRAVSFITQTKLDIADNGCDSSSVIVNPSNYILKNQQTNEINRISFSGDSLLYTFEGGRYLLSTSGFNSEYFEVSPEEYEFTLYNSTIINNYEFCVSAKGEFNDLSVYVFNIDQARPGFITDYLIRYENIGTTTLSGKVRLNFPGDVMFYKQSDFMPSLEESNYLEWDITDLKPFESGEISVQFLLATPTVTPGLQGGEILNIVAEITPDLDDYNESDNSYTLKHTVVNSFDPNDKQCLDGPQITPEMIGDYVHYMIRFENIGTASAVNVIINDIIDTTQFVFESIEFVESSHEALMVVSDENKLEFYFNDIYLSHIEGENTGFVIFKIRTKDDLQLGDVLENGGEIYFDFNHPIITNIATTLIDQTSTTIEDHPNNLDIEVYPNPFVNQLSFSIRNYKITDGTFELLDNIGRTLQSFPLSGNSEVFDLNNFAPGIYLYRITDQNNYITSGKLVKVDR